MILILEWFQALNNNNQNHVLDSTQTYNSLRNAHIIQYLLIYKKRLLTAMPAEYWKFRVLL